MKWKFWKNNKEKRDDSFSNVYSYGLGFANSIFSNDGAATSLSAVFSAVELISNSVAELPIYVKQKADGNKSDIVEHHPIYNALNDNVMTKFMLIKTLVSDMLLYGNGYAYIKRTNIGTPLEIIYCPAGTVTCIWSEKHKQPYYSIPQITSRKIEPINMIHLMKNTVDGYNGRGILQYAAKTLKLANFTEKAATSFFGSGCHLGGVLSTDATRLTDQQRKDIRTAWQQAHGGNNPNGIAVLEAGMKYSPVTVNSRDAQLIETRLFNLQEVARFFNINPTLIGDMSGASYGTLEASNLEFLTHTLMPIITLIQDEFNRKLILPSEANLYVDLDENYLVRPDKSSQASYLNTLVAGGIISINEARRQLGMNPIENGDTHIIPYTDLSQNSIENMKNNEEEQNGEE